jgi:hypothetical protein
MRSILLVSGTWTKLRRKLKHTVASKGVYGQQPLSHWNDPSQRPVKTRDITASMKGRDDIFLYIENHLNRCIPAQPQASGVSQLMIPFGGAIFG